MPDQYGFDHLPSWGVVSHRCIEEGCGWPGHGVVVAERDRKRHHLMHTRGERQEAKQRKAEAAALRLANLAKAREAKKRKREEEAA